MSLLERELINASYDVSPPETIRNLRKDKYLTTKRVKVYHDPLSGEAYVIHRGTNDLPDLWTDTKWVFGQGTEQTNRFQHSLKIQRQAERKYGVQNIHTFGHSLGGELAKKVGSGQNKEIKTFNAPIHLREAFHTTPTHTNKANVHEVRSRYDPVSIVSLLKSAKEFQYTELPGASHSITPIKNDIRE